MSKETKRHLLVEKYKNEHCTTEEVGLIKQWYKGLDKHDLPNEEQVDQASSEVTSKVLRIVAELQIQQAKKRLLWWAASVAAILLVVFTFWKTNESSKNSISVFSQSADLQETVTARGEKKELTLPDGSTIVLNAASSIRYPQNFGEESREIQLEGQAFFNVVPNPERPFIVYTKKLTVKVLGTSFDVQAYDTDRKVAVRVATGKVAVSQSGDSKKQLAMLHPGEQFDFDKENDLAQTIPIEIQKITDWQKNILNFEFVPLKDICNELERIYATPIIIENKDILQERYHLIVQDEELDNILLLLSKSGKGFSIEKKDGKIILR